MHGSANDSHITHRPLMQSKFCPTEVPFGHARIPGQVAEPEHAAPSWIDAGAGHFSGGQIVDAHTKCPPWHVQGSVEVDSPHAFETYEQTAPSWVHAPFGFTSEQSDLQFGGPNWGHCQLPDSHEHVSVWAPPQSL